MVAPERVVDNRMEVRQGAGMLPKDSDMAGSIGDVFGEYGERNQELADAGILELRQGRNYFINEESTRVLSKFGLSLKDQRFAENIACGAFPNLLACAEDAGLPISTYAGAFASSKRLKIRGAVRALLQEGSDAWMTTKEEMIAYLEKVVFTPIAGITPESDLASSETVGKFGVTLKSFSKEKAAEMLVRLQGWNVAEELTVSVDMQVADMMARIRAGKKIQLTKVLAQKTDCVTLVGHDQQHFDGFDGGTTGAGKESGLGPEVDSGGQAEREGGLEGERSDYPVDQE